MPDVRIDDFSGGVTDDYLNCPYNFAQSMMNFLIDRNKKLTQRSGSYRSPSAQNPLGASAVHTTFYFGKTNTAPTYPNNLILVSTGKFYYYSSPNWTLVNANAIKFTLYVKPTFIGDNRWVITGWSSSAGDAPPYMLINQTNGLKITRLGYPTSPITGTITPQSADAKNYIYYFVYRRQYTTESLTTYLSEGPTTAYAKTGMADMSGAGHYNDITGIPKCDGTGTLTSALGYLVGSSDVSYTHVAIYRTTHNGTIPYYVDIVPYASSTFTDTIPDSTLITRAILYTVGGEVQHDQFKQEGLEWAVTQHCHFACTDTGKYFFGTNKRINQTIPGNIDTCPGSFTTYIPEAMTSMIGFRDYALVFSYRSTYRLEGSIDPLGMGSLYVQTVSKTIGCAARHSPVRTDNGVYFLSENGICFTDGFSVIRLTPHLRTTLAIAEQSEITSPSKDKYSGVYDPTTNTIRWLFELPPSYAPHFIILHLDHTRLEEGGGAVTFWNLNNDVRCLSYTHADVFGHAYGYIHTFDTTYTTDNVYSTTYGWYTTGIYTEYISGVWSFGTELLKKWITHFEAVFSNVSNLFVQFYHANDAVSTFTQLHPMRFDDYSTVKRALRRVTKFTRGMLRSTFKQIKMTKGLLNLYEYTAYSTATTSGFNPTSALLNTTPPIFPASLVGLNAYFEYTMVGGVSTLDNYTTPFPILTRSDDTITVGSNSALYPKALVDAKWKIKGYGTDQKMTVLGLTIPFEVLGPKSQPTSEIGEDAAP